RRRRAAGRLRAGGRRARQRGAPPTRAGGAAHAGHLTGRPGTGAGRRAERPGRAGGGRRPGRGRRGGGGDGHLAGAHAGRAGARARAAAAARPRPAVRTDARAVRRRGGAGRAGRPPGPSRGGRRRAADRGGLMGSLTRVRAHGGLWTLVALLAGLAVLVAATAGPVVVRMEDRALRKLVEQAPSYLDRDILAVRSTPPSLMGTPPTPPETMLTEVGSILAPSLR